MVYIINQIEAKNKPLKMCILNGYIFEIYYFPIVNSMFSTGTSKTFGRTIATPL